MKKRLKLRIPETLNEITLGQYQNWIEVATKEGNAGTYFIKQKTIEIFCHVPLKFVATIAHKTVETLYNQLSNLLLQEDKDFVQRFKMNGIEYGFIPDFENMSSGEYIDITSNFDWSNMHKAISVMFRPVTQTLDDKYLIEDYDGIKDEHIMKNLPADIAINTVFFLSNSMMILEASLQDYLRQELTQNPQWSKILTQNSGGSMPYMPSLGMILQRSMKSHLLILEPSLQS